MVLQPLTDQGKPRCQEPRALAAGEWSFSQCRRAAKVGEYCKQHSPELIAKKEAKRRAELEYKREQHMRGVLWGAYGESAMEIIKEIAAGHNDPRALATEYLERIEENK